ncbi:hypothetical protein [Clostridium ganghwense]|uniref:FeS cluster biogenesis domain-containing protein n=1 Tax=Clostridium ganghwense TaxID=312089 RepID=A0ABT4CP48_9CLOT|nr:hypothetical protein [Clostridium ganghwense]MCY6370830.1 hypothetical protein [Clostridium ganghwense]
MITINNTALKTAKNMNASFVIRVTTSGCGCGGGIRKSLWIELSNDFVDINNHYTLFEYEGVNVYISKKLNLSNNVYIFQKFKFPVIGPVFSSKGISIS